MSKYWSTHPGTISTLVNDWNPSILILQSAFTWPVQPSCLDSFYQDQLKLRKVTCFHLSSDILHSKKSIQISQNAKSMMASCVQKTIMTGRLIQSLEWNLICFTCMHTAKGTREVPNRREIISEQLGENLLLHVPNKCLNFTTKTWKSCHPQICRRRFNLDTRVMTVSLKNFTEVTFVLYQTYV